MSSKRLMNLTKKLNKEMQDLEKDIATNQEENRMLRDEIESLQRKLVQIKSEND